MPSTSKKQHNLMAMVANNPAKAKELGIPQKVGQEFTQADKGLKFGAGPKTRPDLQKVNKPSTRHGKTELFKEGGRVMAKSIDAGNSKTMQKVKTAAPSRDGVASKGKTKGKQIVMPGNKGMKKGGMAKC
jgi:hypothetical protein